MNKTPALAVLSATLATGAFAADWLPTTAGTYDYFATANWTGGNVTGNMRLLSEAVGDQTINMSKALTTTGNFWPGGSAGASAPWQIFTGNSITVNGSNASYRFMNGRVVHENALLIKTVKEAPRIGHVAPGELVLRNGGSLYFSGNYLSIGFDDANKYSAATGRVILEAPATLAADGKNLWASDGRTGAIWMEGGLITLTNALFGVGYAADGYVRVNDGTVSLRADAAEAMRLGQSANSYASLHLTGGTVTTRRTGTIASEPYVNLANSQAAAADVYVEGGVLDFSKHRVAVGNWSSSVNGRSSVTVAGTGVAKLGYTCMSIGNGAGTASVNLNEGGTLETSTFATYNKTASNGKRFLNFNGGTLLIPNGVSLESTSFDLVVYPKGGTIKTAGTATFGMPLRAATGWGVKEIVLTNPGANYVAAPRVVIEGGSGARATGYAVLNRDGTIARVAVTCPGEGYRADDQLTVSFVSASPNVTPAAAAVVLAENTTPTLLVDGAVDLKGTHAFTGKIRVVSGSPHLNGAAFEGTDGLSAVSGTMLRPVRGSVSSIHALVPEHGVTTLRYEGTNGTATVLVGSYALGDSGFGVIDYMDELAFSIGSTDYLSTSAVSPVVNGLVFSAYNPSGYRSPKVLERAADGTVSVATTTEAIGPDANWCPTTAKTTVQASAVNSITLPLTPGVEATIEYAGPVEVKSGMMVVRRPHEGVQRIAVSGGGAFTTRAKGGMIIYADQYETAKRSNSQSKDNVVYCGNWRRIYGPFADPDASTPMSLTIVGELKSRPELGAVAWLLDSNSFSGGLNLINGGVFCDADSRLGKLGAAITAEGYCSIAARNWTLDIGARPLTINDGSALLFSPAWGNSGNTIAVTLKGTGDLLTSDVCRSGYAIAYTGDHSAYEGQYYIMGHARITPETFGPKARVYLADGTNGIGVIETQGTFTRPLGTGKGSICWRKHRTMPAAYGLRGGFAAKGGDLAVNLGGSGETLVAGSEPLPAGAVISLQSQYADGALTVANGLDLNGRIQEVSVWEGKSAKLTGELKDSVGGGALKVTGGGTLTYGGTINAVIGPDGLVGNPIAVEGDLTVDGAKIVVTASDDDLKSLEGRTIPLISVSGKLGGKFAYEIANSRWRVKTTSSGVVLSEVPGSAIIIR